MPNQNKQEEWVKIKEDRWHQTWLHKEHGERLINTELLNYILHQEREKAVKEMIDREKTMQEWDKRRLDILAMTRRETIENAIEYIENKGFPSIGLREFLASLEE